MSATDPRSGARVRLPAPLVLVVSIAIAVALRYIVGALIIVAGLAMGLPANRLLLADGIYRHTRNPMYVSMVLIVIGIGVAAGNLWIVLMGAPFLLVVHYTSVLPEEAYLDEKFGDSYRDYKKKVRRYL